MLRSSRLPLGVAMMVLGAPAVHACGSKVLKLVPVAAVEGGGGAGGSAVGAGGSPVGGGGDGLGGFAAAGGVGGSTPGGSGGAAGAGGAVPVCGDGIVNQGSGGGPPVEQCDDGNDDPFDDCYQCEWTNSVSYDACPGQLLMLAPGVLVVPGMTGPYSDDYSHQAQPPGCQLAGMGGGNDRVYEIVPTADGTLHVDIGWDATQVLDICEAFGPNDPGCWDRALFLLDEICTTQLVCSDDWMSWEAIEEISWSVLAGQSYHLVVDTQSPQPIPGHYYLHLSLVP